MSEQTIFARAIPHTIRLTETYTYDIEISGTPQLLTRGTPAGCIEIITPFDGEKHFSKQAFEDVAKQLKNNSGQEQILARIGHVSLTDYAHTDLEDKANLTLCYNVLPIDVLVQGNDLEGLRSLHDDRHACHTTLDYTPNWPETHPLSITANIFDEDTIKAAENTEEGETAANKVAQQVGFERSLIFDFGLQISLPGRVGRNQDSEPPELARMAIEWPVATSYRLVHLFVGGKEKPTIYNPEEGVIEWAHIPFNARGQTEGTKLYSYYTPPIRLYVDDPGELYQRPELSGRVRIEIPRPFSGLRLCYFNTFGNRKEISIETRTVLAANLILNLEDCFERKVFSPYQHLQFQGVVLDGMRITDIMTLLQDQRFRCEHLDVSQNHSRAQRHLIIGSRPEGPGELELLILAVGTRSETERQKQILGGETFTTRLETGNTVIYMRGQLEGDSRRLLGVMNDIQAMLKERFRHVKTIE